MQEIYGGVAMAYQNSTPKHHQVCDMSMCVGRYPYVLHGAADVTRNCMVVLEDAAIRGRPEAFVFAGTLAGPPHGACRDEVCWLR